MIVILSGFRCETLDSTRGMTEFRRRGGGCHFELRQRFNSWRRLIERRTRIRALHADSIEKNLCTKVLSSRQLGFENACAGVIAVGSRPRGSRREEDERLRGSDKALSCRIQSQRKVFDLFSQTRFQTGELSV